MIIQTTRLSNKMLLMFKCSSKRLKPMRDTLGLGSVGSVWLPVVSRVLSSLA